MTAEEIAAIIEAADSDGEVVNSDYDEIGSEVENSDSDSDEASDVPDDPDDGKVYTARSGRQWSTQVPHPASYRGRNRVSQEKQVLIDSNYPDPLEIFKELFDESLMRMIAENTNQRLDLEMSDDQRQHDCTFEDVTVDEVYGFLGILLLLGTLKKRDIEIDEIWSEKENALHRVPQIIATMSRQRFKMLSRYLTFDNLLTRQAECVNDPKFFKCREMLEHVRQKCLRAYEPSAHLSVDECLYSFRGRCSFKQYMPKKPAKYGLKFWQLVDSSNQYLCNFNVYTGKEGKEVTKNLGEKVTLKLVEPFNNSGRNVSTDNYFTSSQLADRLWERNITLVGTIKHGRREVISQAFPSTKREVLSSDFYFSQHQTLISYVPKKGKAVNILTTQHHDRKVDTSNEKKKPDAIHYYNQTMGGSDVLDQLVGYYSCRRTTNRWTMRVFHYLMDVVTANTFTLLREMQTAEEMQQRFGKERSQRRIFREKLAMALMRPHTETRFQRYENFRGVSKQLQESFRISGFQKPIIVDLDLKNNKKPSAGRCHRCENRKSRNTCTSCSKFVCNEHSRVEKNYLCDPAC